MLNTAVARGEPVDGPFDHGWACTLIVLDGRVTGTSAVFALECFVFREDQLASAWPGRVAGPGRTARAVDTEGDRPFGRDGPADIVRARTASISPAQYDESAMTPTPCCKRQSVLGLVREVGLVSVLLPGPGLMRVLRIGVHSGDHPIRADLAGVRQHPSVPSNPRPARQPGPAGRRHQLLSPQCFRFDSGQRGQGFGDQRRDQPVFGVLAIPPGDIGSAGAGAALPPRLGGIEVPPAGNIAAGTSDPGGQLGDRVLPGEHA